jgi:hypothetical protein
MVVDSLLHTLFPSLGEVGEFQDMLESVWQWVKHESMNMPQSSFSLRTFKLVTIVFLNPMEGEKKHLVLQST